MVLGGFGGEFVVFDVLFGGLVDVLGLLDAVAFFKCVFANIRIGYHFFGGLGFRVEFSHVRDVVLIVA